MHAVYIVRDCGAIHGYVDRCYMRSTHGLTPETGGDDGIQIVLLENIEMSYFFRASLQS